MVPSVTDSVSYRSQRTPAGSLGFQYKMRIDHASRPVIMITERELAEKIRSGGTILVAVAYPWGVEFEASNPSETSPPEE